jgi:glyoxylase-like metal-dependent hydrolase (beta-lactamase superfamily II)
MILETFEVGPFLVNCYLVGCETTHDAMIIDPGDMGDMVLERARELNLQVKHIINTHGHADHIKDNGLVKDRTGAPIWIHPLDAPMLPVPNHNLSAFFGFSISSPPADKFLEDGQEFKLGAISFKIIHTPGHSKGGVCLLHDRILFCGDTLFCESIGRTDLPGGDFDALEQSIRNRIYTLDDDVTVYPGHGPATSVGFEKHSNPFVRA